MNNKLYINSLVFSAIATLSSQAALTWQGTNNTFFQESNWQLNGGGSPAGGTIDPNTNITASTAPDGLIVFDNSLGGTSTTAVGGNVDLNGNELQIGDGLSIITTSTFGLRRSTAISGSPIEVSLIDGALGNFQFGRQIGFAVDGSSTLTLRGGGNPLANSSSVDLLEFGALLNFVDETYAAFNTEHASKITVGGEALVFGSDPFAIESGDNALASAFNGVSGVTITAIPEPSSTALLGLGGLALILRRRR